ncbi:hypothetical protein NC651_025916 [Populus alba x Populus x berolinensis]|nr:hypothetical protein NC651_025916 [Populus alba x Populus x berolinensis]
MGDGKPLLPSVIPLLHSYAIGCHHCIGDNGLIQSQLKPSKKGLVLWGNTLIAVVSTMSVAVGAVASVRQIVLDAKTYILFANM